MNGLFAFKKNYFGENVNIPLKYNKFREVEYSPTNTPEINNRYYRLFKSNNNIPSLEIHHENIEVKVEDCKIIEQGYKIEAENVVKEIQKLETRKKVLENELLHQGYSKEALSNNSLHLENPPTLYRNPDSIAVMFHDIWDKQRIDNVKEYGVVFNQLIDLHKEHQNMINASEPFFNSRYFELKNEYEVFKAIKEIPKSFYIENFYKVFIENPKLYLQNDSSVQNTLSYGIYLNFQYLFQLISATLNVECDTNLYSKLVFTFANKNPKNLDMGTFLTVSLENYKATYKKPKLLEIYDRVMAERTGPNHTPTLGEIFIRETLRSTLSKKDD